MELSIFGEQLTLGSHYVCVSNIPPDNYFSTAGSDYEAVTTDFTFVTGSSNGATMSVTVPIIGDEIGEPNETFIISITPSTPDMAASTTITIVNDDSKASFYSPPSVYSNIAYVVMLQALVFHFVFQGIVQIYHLQQMAQYQCQGSLWAPLPHTLVMLATSWWET